MKASLELRVLALASIALIPSSTRGHPISLTTAIAEIEEGRVQVGLRVMAEDIVTIQMVDADANDLFAASILSDEAETYTTIVLEDFTVRDDHGEKLSGEVVEIDRSALPTEGVHRKALMEFSVVYRIKYELETRPPSLTFAQNFSARPGVLLSMTDLIVLHYGKLVGQPTQVTPDNPYTVTLTWRNRWFARLEFWLYVFSAVLLLACAAEVWKAKPT